MGYPKLGHMPSISFVDTMMEQRGQPDAIFGFYMTNKRPDKQPEMSMGYYDKSKFKGDMTWIKTINHEFFSVPLDDIKIKGQPLNICK